jgi:hypothetical protein
MIFFNRKSRIEIQDEDESLVATLRIREERLQSKEAEYARRDAELSHRETVVRREESRLRHWGMELADAAGYLKGLFAKCDRFGFRQGASEVEKVAGEAIEALRPGKRAAEVRETPKTKIRASQAEQQDDDPDSNVALQSPENSGSSSDVGMCIRMPGISDEPEPAHLRSESVLYADMKRLSLLPEQASGAESSRESVNLFGMAMAG